MATVPIALVSDSDDYTRKVVPWVFMRLRKTWDDLSGSKYSWYVETGKRSGIGPNERMIVNQLPGKAFTQFINQKVY